jgi:hypothetical protein
MSREPWTHQHNAMAAPRQRRHAPAFAGIHISVTRPRPSRSHRRRRRPARSHRSAPSPAAMDRQIGDVVLTDETKASAVNGLSRRPVILRLAYALEAQRRRSIRRFRPSWSGRVDSGRWQRAVADRHARRSKIRPGGSLSARSETIAAAVRDARRVTKAGAARDPSTLPRRLSSGRANGLGRDRIDGSLAAYQDVFIPWAVTRQNQGREISVKMRPMFVSQATGHPPRVGEHTPAAALPTPQHRAST